MLMTAINSFANTSFNNSTPNVLFQNETQILNSIDVISESGNSKIIDNSENSIIIEDGIVTMAQTSGIIDGAVYRIKNVVSNKYLNVHYGIDSDGTNIYQWTADGSTEQKFKVVYSENTDTYKLYAMCSSNGTNRVLSASRGNSNLENGQNAQLYSPTDSTAQNLRIVSLGQNQYRIGFAANYNLYLTVNGDSNGTALGTSPNSAGNTYISNYADDMRQHWIFELLESSTPSTTPVGHLDSVSATTITGWAYQSNIPNTALDVHIYIRNDSTGEEKGFATTANQYRSDLASVGYGDGYHGFSYNINWKNFLSGTYTVRAYAIGINSSNPQLTNYKSFQVKKIEGAVETLNDSYVSGWVWKPDAPNESIDVHLYIRNSNNEILFSFATTANTYRDDLQASGYGNGYHAFTIPINWSALPEEKLQVTLFAIDGSGENPAFYHSYYDNRLSITLFGMTDANGIDQSTWMWDNNIVTYCENIGCSKLNRLNYADETNQNYSYSRFIKESSYCAIATHGCKDGIQWSMRNMYNGHTNCENNLCSVCYGLYTVEDIGKLNNNYFANTRCVVTVACEAAKGGENDLNNFVNALHSKGVKTVVGFEEETWFVYNPSTYKTLSNVGSMKWLSEFTRLIGEGETIANAERKAYSATISANLIFNNYTQHDLDNNLIPENIKTEKIICGLDSCCIVGDKSQIVKH